MAYKRTITDITTTKLADHKTGEVVTRLESKSKTTKHFQFSLMGLHVLVLIIFSVIGILQGRSDQRTFYSFLEMLSNVPEVELGFSNLINTELNFPNWLNWAENVVEIGAGFLGLLGFFLEGLISVTMYLWYFVRWIFVF